MIANTFVNEKRFKKIMRESGINQPDPALL
jgi:hypothetical protein